MSSPAAARCPVACTLHSSSVCLSLCWRCCQSSQSRGSNCCDSPRCCECCNTWMSTAFSGLASFHLFCYRCFEPSFSTKDCHRLVIVSFEARFVVVVNPHSTNQLLSLGYDWKAWLVKYRSYLPAGCWWHCVAHNLYLGSGLMLERVDCGDLIYYWLAHLDPLYDLYRFEIAFCFNSWKVYPNCSDRLD